MAMAKSPLFRLSIVFCVVMLIAVIAIVRSTMLSFSELCEVCITFGGRTECREAYGKTREDAIRTATDNACAPIAGGMTDSINCSNTEPDRVTCEP
jgi:hypothetical protein